MRILISAYACEPNKGSEPGVGWNWVINIAKKGHEVTVITRRNNKLSIDNYFKNEDIGKLKIDFIYCDFSPWIQRLKKKIKFIQIYYFIWQIKAFFIAKKSHLSKKFELVHHITFVSIRSFSLMWLIGIPFIYGPIAGGESSPFWLRWKISFRGGINDTLRDILIFFSRIDPFHQMSLKKAKLIIVSTNHTKNLIPKKYFFKTIIISQIGVKTRKNYPKLIKSRNKKILYVGKFLYLKGMSMGIEAFARALQIDPDLKLTLVGGGKEINRWKNLSKKLNVENNIEWNKWATQKDLEYFYRNNGIFLFPSLHDSAGQVLLESISFGLVPICLKLGGPGEIVQKEIGFSVDVYKSTYQDIINKLAENILFLSQDEEKWKYFSKKAFLHSKSLSWQSKINQLNFY